MFIEKYSSPRTLSLLFSLLFVFLSSERSLWAQERSSHESKELEVDEEKSSTLKVRSKRPQSKFYLALATSTGPLFFIQRDKVHVEFVDNVCVAFGLHLTQATVIYLEPCVGTRKLLFGHSENQIVNTTLGFIFWLSHRKWLKVGLSQSGHRMRNDDDEKVDQPNGVGGNATFGYEYPLFRRFSLNIFSRVSFSIINKTDTRAPFNLLHTELGIGLQWH